MMHKYSLLIILCSQFALSCMQESNQPKQYYQSLKSTRHYDDTIENMFIKKSLFKQLFVQAHKDEKLEKTSFLELCDKLNKGRIREAEDTRYIFMTSKDIWHRLLSYIPYVQGLVVNGKKVKLECRGYQTKEDKIETEKECAGIEQEEARAQELGKEFRQLCHIRFFSGDKIVCTYSFDREDPEHHERIVHEFKNITNVEW